MFLNEEEEDLRRRRKKEKNQNKNAQKRDFAILNDQQNVYG